MRTLALAVLALSAIALAAPIASADITNEQTTTTCPNDGFYHYHTAGNGGTGCFSIPVVNKVLELLNP